MFDVTPPTDNRPFFFHLLKPSQWFRFDRFGGQKHLNQASYVLMILFIGACILAITVMSISCFTGKSSLNSLHGRFLDTTYFACIGLAFIMVEVILIQKMTLFLGHPVYSVSLILFSFLLFSGIGAYKSSKSGMQRKLFIFLSILIFCSAFLLPVLIKVTIGQSRVIKLFISLAILFPFGFLMGRPFPVGLQYLGNVAPDRIPFAYAVNGAFSVLGAVSAMILGISAGYTWVLVLAALLYGCTGFVAGIIQRTKNTV
jgi:hypothetical protein